METAVFRWQHTQNGEVRILRGYAASPYLIIPERIAGRPVTEIADYCFAPDGHTPQESYLTGDYEQSGIRLLAGGSLQGIVLPDTVRKIGSLAFYDCSSLEEIAFSGALQTVGSDVFMNCRRLHKMTVRASLQAVTGLKQLLTQKKEDVEVCFMLEGKQTQAVFFYPEYFEGYDEIGPAHIFALNLTGEGFRARQCFKDGVVDVAAYDRIFEQAKAEESRETLCTMAADRLCYPAFLGQEAEKRYREYLGQEQIYYAKQLVQSRKLQQLQYLIRQEIFGTQTLEQCITWASQAHWPEGAAALLQLQTQHTVQSVRERYTFDDF